MACQTPCILNSLTFKDQNGTPQRPAASRLKLYARQDGRLYTIGPDGTVLPVGTGDGNVTSVAAETADPNLLITGSPVTGSGTFTFALQGISAFVRTVFDDANATAVRSTLGLVIGTDVQAHSSDLDNFVTFAVWAGSSLTLTGSQLTVEDLVVNGASSFAGAVLMGSLLSVTGAVTGGTLASTANTTVGADLIVTGGGSFGSITMASGSPIGLGSVAITESGGDLNVTTGGGAMSVTGSISSTVEFVVGSGGSPTITSGSGAPGSTPPDGSLYLESATGGLYVRESGAWVLK